MDVLTLFKTLREFRAWIDQSKRKRVRFMRGYKEKIEKGIAPKIGEFRDKYGKTQEGSSPLFDLILDTFYALRGPVRLMETELRPSVGMGVFLERWMMASAVESYLKECCHEADRHLDELEKEIESGSGG